MPDSDSFAIEPSSSGRMLCGGCVPDGVCRLGVEPRDGMWFDVTCPRHWQGGPGVAHGGWIAAAFDDVLNTAALRTEPRMVTKSLSVEYLRPVPVDRKLAVLAKIERHEGREWTVSARMTLGADTLATAHAELRTRRPDHYSRHEHWLAGHPLPTNEN